MNEGFYRQTARIEDAHWWFRHRRRLAAALLERELGAARVDRALDVGCGCGGNLPLLEARARRVVGVDRSPLALALARSKHPHAVLLRADANRLSDSLRPKSFDLITVFNVLYHRWVTNDAAVLEQLGRLLRPGGALLLTEPALELLYRRHDCLDYGARRYTRAQLVAMAARAGLRVRMATYFAGLALLPAAFVAAADRLRGRLARPLRAEEQASELRLPPRGLNELLLALGAPERWWIARCSGRIPLGVGLLLLARREPPG